MPDARPRRLPRPRRRPFGLRSRSRGVCSSLHPLTGSVSDICVQRVLVRQGVSRDLCELLIADLREAIAHFDKHPTTVPMTKEESGGFSHL